jgi:hypothetical protein
MPDTPVAAVPDKGLLSRALGIIVSPAETYEVVAVYPRPATILFFVCLVLGLATALPQLTEHGRQVLLDAQIQGVERFTHQPVTPEMYARFQNTVRYAAFTTFGSVFISVPVISLLVGAVFWAIFNAILGGTATFKQVLAIVTHSQVIGALGVVIAAHIIWFKGIQSFAGPFNLGALAPMLEPTTALATFLSGVSVFTLWQLIVSAIGLGVLYRRKPTGIAVFLVAAYLLLAAGFTAIFSSLTNR